jgi:hypothetical protein
MAFDASRARSQAEARKQAWFQEREGHLQETCAGTTTGSHSESLKISEGIQLERLSKEVPGVLLAVLSCLLSFPGGGLHGGDVCQSRKS